MCIRRKASYFITRNPDWKFVLLVLQGAMEVDAVAYSVYIHGLPVVVFFLHQLAKICENVITIIILMVLVVMVTLIIIVVIVFTTTHHHPR